ncbi:MAG: hypothetical protein LBD22_07025 [Spirochaetaceae bacterium]|jgi:hypothetical protein|nr:hypothetical protein [Spirochaetaceae bacterium]
MYDETNPYQSPQTESIPVSGTQSGTFFTESMLDNLRRTAPWARFIGILGFICAGLIILSSFSFIMILITSTGALFASSGFEWAELFRGTVGIIGAIVYSVLGALYFLPARFLYVFGTKIRNYFLSYNREDLEAAFRNNFFLWKFLGIFVIVILTAIPVFIIASIILVFSLS